ncbi:hypothetical protein L1887_32976 [Cichorium endivia]|nr:hypothetical protein L1887_32976 [Cichorium endivia]
MVAKYVCGKVKNKKLEGYEMKKETKGRGYPKEYSCRKGSFGIANSKVYTFDQREIELRERERERETERFRERKLKQKVGEGCVCGREFLLHGGGAEKAVEVWEVLEEVWFLERESGGVGN